MDGETGKKRSARLSGGGKYFGNVWGLGDTRKLDDGLRRGIPLNLTICIYNHFVQQPGFEMFRNLITFHPLPHRSPSFSMLSRFCSFLRE